MMKIAEMKKRKKELRYTNAMVAEKSGVPLGTVQKIFSGETKNPRVDTLEAMERVLKQPLPCEYSLEEEPAAMHVSETLTEYSAGHAAAYADRKTEAQRVDRWKAKAEPTARWPRQGQYTIEDYYAVPDDVRIELIDGTIYELSTPTLNHQRVQFAMASEFSRCIDDHGMPCEVIVSPFDVRLDRDNSTMVEPDLIIVCDKEIDGDARYLDGAPDMAVEILSPSTRVKDCTVKLRKYMNAGVREYWIVDIGNERVTVYTFEEDVLPVQYSFRDSIPVGISDGACSIDFDRIKKRLK